MLGQINPGSLTSPLGRSRRRWEDNINVDFREIGWGAMD
jgi:hypothetical protein